jgi:hypothetical protein
MLKKIIVFAFFFICQWVVAQVEKEVNPPYHIKTISFVQDNENVLPVFNLNDSFELQFDDLYGNEANYYYSITHYDYDWQPSQLQRNEYIQGFDNQRIINYTNSFNALQIYSHYKIQFPNTATRLLVSGNYMLKILNESKEVVFSRKFILCENIVQVPIQVRRSRTGKDINYKHNLDFSIKSNTIQFQTPNTNVKILIYQNGQINNGITNIKPMYTIGNDLIYRYDKETQFWAGNEFLFFENKTIRVAANSVGKVDSNSGVYNSHLYTNIARNNQAYTDFRDVNGNFVVSNFGSENPQIESDYAWVYFSLSAPTYYGKNDIYVNGMFNNYALSEENRMEYNKEKGLYEKAIMIKQGFTNYQYVIADKTGKIDAENAIDGNFFQTENLYNIIVYYRMNGQRYDRVIGKGAANSINIIN